MEDSGAWVRRVFAQCSEPIKTRQIRTRHQWNVRTIIGWLEVFSSPNLSYFLELKLTKEPYTAKTVLPVTIRSWISVSLFIIHNLQQSVKHGNLVLLMNWRDMQTSKISNRNDYTYHSPPGLAKMLQTLCCQYELCLWSSVVRPVPHPCTTWRESGSGALDHAIC